MIETNTVIDILALKLCGGTKRLQGNVRTITLAQEESSFIDSRLIKEGRKRHISNKCRNEGWT